MEMIPIQKAATKDEDVLVVSAVVIRLNAAKVPLTGRPSWSKVPAVPVDITVVSRHSEHLSAEDCRKMLKGARANSRLSLAGWLGLATVFLLVASLSAMDENRHLQHKILDTTTAWLVAFTVVFATGTVYFGRHWREAGEPNDEQLRKSEGRLRKLALARLANSLGLASGWPALSAGSDGNYYHTKRNPPPMPPTCSDTEFVLGSEDFERFLVSSYVRLPGIIDRYCHKDYLVCQQGPLIIGAHKRAERQRGEAHHS